MPQPPANRPAPVNPPTAVGINSHMMPQPPANSLAPVNPPTAVGDSTPTGCHNTTTTS